MTESMDKTAGVMGGMGPDATVDFMAKVIALTDSGRDQDHVHMIVDHDPTVPNRQEAIRGEDSDVADRLAAMARRLQDAMLAPISWSWFAIQHTFLSIRYGRRAASRLSASSMSRFAKLRYYVRLHKRLD